MPVLNIVGSTACNKTFFAGFGFISNEKEESYNFLLQCLIDILDKEKINHPQTILTDKEKGLMNAIEQYFPFASNVICIWHIHQNILTKAHPILAIEIMQTVYSNDVAEARKENDQYKQHIDQKWKKFQNTFNMIVFAKTEDEKDDAVASFKTEYSDEVWQPVLQYIDDEWLNDNTTRHFLLCYMQDCTHFGQISTSQNESAHWMLKCDLQVSTNDLLTTWASFDCTIQRQH